MEELQATVTNPEYGDGYMINGDLYLWDGEQWNNIARIQGPEVELTKAKIEAALVGEVTTHTHDTRYYTKDQVDDTINGINTNLTNNYYNKSQVDSKLTAVYRFKGSVATENDLPTEGNIVGDVYNILSNDKNVAWTESGWDSLSSSIDLASLTANGLMSKEDFAKLQGIEANAQVNKIENITKRVQLNIVNKNVTIPEDIKISETEPTEEEIMWLDPSEDYNFASYTQEEVDANFVNKSGDSMTGDLLINGGKVWNANNDGADSGLDADLLDGIQSERIIFGDNEHGTIDIATPERPDLTINTINKSGFYRDNVTSLYDTNDYTLWLPEIIHWEHPETGTGYEYSLQILSGYDANKLYFRKRKNGVWSTARQLVDTVSLEDSLAYWYENDENNPSTTCNRGGNRNVIESLRSKFKRCVSYPQADGSTIISYLNDTDSSKYPDGSNATNGYTQNIDIMVHFPKYYHKTVEVTPGRWRTYISEVQINNDYIEEPECLVGAFEAYKDSTVDWLSSITGKLSTASQTISTFYTQAHAKGADWGLIDYRAHATIARMFCAYYGTTNISTLNEDIPCSGGTKRDDHGLTGGTLSLGNKDGRIEAREDTGYYSTSFLGLEDCYYSKWEFVQGLNIIGENYITYDGGCFPGKDVAALEEAGATNIRVIGAKPYSSEAEGTYYNGWIRRVAQGRYGDVMPTEIGGSESTYYADYTWQYKQAETGERIFLRSGRSDHGSRCGVFVATCHNGSSDSYVNGGSRLGFYGKINVVDSDTFKSIAGIIFQSKR